MACFLCFFDGSPLEDDPKASRPSQFQISMLDACYRNQPVCCLGYFCPCCCACYLRGKALDGDWTRYACCQGYFCPANTCGERYCPWFCMCLEAVICLGPSISATRMYVMDLYDLRPDPCDNQLIRFSNCLQIMACICTILAVVFRELQECARAMRCVADCVFYTTLGCMISQTDNEIKLHQSGVPSNRAPPEATAVVVTHQPTPSAPLDEPPYSKF